LTLDGPRTAPPLLGSFRLGGPSAYLCKLGPFFKVPTKSSRNRGPRKESCIGFRRPAPKLLRKKGGPQLVWELGPCPNPGRGTQYKVRDVSNLPSMG